MRRSGPPDGRNGAGRPEGASLPRVLGPAPPPTVEQTGADRTTAIRSSVRGPSFDDAQSRLTTCEGHVVGHHRLCQPFQSKFADFFKRRRRFDCDSYPLSNKDLPVRGLGAEPGRNIAHCADRGVAGAFGKADLAERRIALRDTGAKAQITTTLAPVGDQLTRRLAHRHRHPDRALGWVRTGHRIVKEHHDPVARELVESTLELRDERP